MPPEGPQGPGGPSRGDNPYLTALGEGYEPKDILDHLAQTDQGLAPQIAEARQAGHSDDDIVAYLAQNHVSGGAGDGAGGGPGQGSQAPTDLWSAAKAGLYDATGSLESGAGGLLRYAGVAPQTAADLDQRAASNASTAGQTSQMAPDIAGGYGAAYQNDGLAGVARRAAYQVARGAGEAAAPLTAAGLLATAPESGAATAIGAGGAALATFLQSLGGDRQEKQAQGLDPSKVSSGDLGNAAFQTVIQALPYESGGLGFVGRQLLHAADSGARSLVSEGSDILGAYLQGGDPGTAAAIASKLIDAGVTGALSKPAFDAAAVGPAVASDAISRRATALRAGANLRAFANETADWSQAVGNAAERLQQANPAMSPEEVQSRAYVLAQKAGATPPTFENLSPQAQNGQAELATVQMYQAARDAMTKGMGRPDADIPPAQVFKNVVSDVSRNLQDMASLLQRNGLIDRDQAGAFTDAIAQARKHNVQAGENGAEFGWFDTLRDQVAALPIDPAYRNQALQQLRVLDLASQASLLKNSKGPLERNAGLLGPAVVAGLAGLFHGADVATLGGFGATLVKGRVAMT